MNSYLLSFTIYQYLGFLLFVVITLIGFWLLFLLCFVIPYWMVGALRAYLRERKRQKNEVPTNEN